MKRIAHISDLHFSKIMLHPSILFSKRLIGTLNLIFNRKKSYSQKHLVNLNELLTSLDVNYLFVTGDLTCTSSNEEFAKAKDFLKSIDKKIEPFVIPGNHDQYTKKAYKNSLFYDYFNSHRANFLKKLTNEKIEICPISEKWYYIGLDTCIPTPLFSCWGYFSKELEQHLEEVLNEIPKDKNIVLVNHFPIFHKTSKRKALKRRDRLIDIIKKYPNIKIYLHGHTHFPSIKKLNNLPYMICSGCISYKKNASFNILEIGDESCKVINYLWKDDKWQINKTHKILFS